MCPSDPELQSKTSGAFDFRPAFDVLDADQDGKISHSDLKKFMRGYLDSDASEEDIVSMISVADANKNGFVEFDEFQIVLGMQKKSPDYGVLEDVFRALDGDGDGKIGFEDLKSYMNCTGLSIDDDEIKAMMKIGGRDEKNGIFYQDLIKILEIDSSL